MIVTCKACGTRFDDEYRWTFCPHETFAANDGKNNFAHYPESLIEEAEAYLRSPNTEIYGKNRGTSSLRESVRRTKARLRKMFRHE